MQFPASSSASSDLYPNNSGPLQIINQSSPLPFLCSTICCINGNSRWVTSVSILHSPQNKAGKKIYSYNTPPQPLTKQLLKCNICIMWQFLSAIRPPSPSVWLPCVISILSKPQKIITQEEKPESQSQQVCVTRKTQISVFVQRQES
ncbi:PREDICTED: uncharacterized protein LOC107101924 isoform X2 [Cyprinodon variegatus]|uniref:uncharacterized protein LOC107101924 isoform X2 n=1 Tax=Cyprinodon variegatus TaxID=28743 RepID=UPI00074290D2|nr:PREDICTED: uncharacterized protein LOC107101924 isoform X2 [Cyprinodon variegatus]